MVNACPELPGLTEKLKVCVPVPLEDADWLTKWVPAVSVTVRKQLMFEDELASETVIAPPVMPLCFVSKAPEHTTIGQLLELATSFPI